MPVPRQFCFNLTALTLLLSGCAHQPAQVEATIPLVHDSLAFSLKNKDANIIPTELLRSNRSVTVGDDTFVVGSLYTSAVGAQCYWLHLQARNDGTSDFTRSACKENGEWVLLPALVKKPVVNAERKAK